MKFIKDILFFDLETTGPNPDKDSVIQLSGVLLDKDSLLEKSNFSSPVRVSLLENTISQHAKILGIAFEAMQKSPKIYDAAKHFYQRFGSNLILASRNVENVFFLKAAFKKSALSFDYDSRVLDLWSLGYVYSLHYGLKKISTFNTLLDLLGLKLKNPNSSLERARLCAEIFRRIIKES